MNRRIIIRAKINRRAVFASWVISYFSYMVNLYLNAQLRAGCLLHKLHSFKDLIRKSLSPRPNWRFPC